MLKITIFVAFVAMRRSGMKRCGFSHAMVPVLRMDHGTEVLHSFMCLLSLPVTLTLPLNTLVPA